MYFNDAARNWDTIERINRAKILANYISTTLKQTRDMKALEIGCGTGLITLNVKNVFKEISCIDTSDEMIKILKDKIQENGFENIHILSNKILTEGKVKFDVVYSSMVFHHIEDVRDELMKIHSILNNEGHLLIIDLDEEDGSFHMNEKDFHGHNGFKRESFRKLLEECNYKDITFQTVFNGEKNINNKHINYSLFLCLAKKIKYLK